MRKNRIVSAKDLTFQLEDVPLKYVRNMIHDGIIPRAQKVAGTYAIWLVPPVEKIYSVNDAAEYLGIDNRRIRALVESGDLDYDKIKTLGRTGWAYVFAESDLDKIDKSPLKRGPKPRGDKHLKQLEDGRYEIVGTHNSNGQPFTYLRLSVARRRAREAYDDGLLFKAGDSIAVWLSSRKLRHLYGARAIIAELLEDITLIDRSIVVSIRGNRHVLTRKSLIDHATKIDGTYCGACGGKTVQYVKDDRTICAYCQRTNIWILGEKNHANLLTS